MRQLRSFGWTVSHISFLDWDHKCESERRQLVAAKFDELGIPVGRQRTGIDDDLALKTRRKEELFAKTGGDQEIS